MKLEYELSEEQKVLIAQRKEQLKLLAEEEYKMKRVRAKRYIMDARATALKLIRGGYIKRERLLNRTEEDLRRFLKIVCIAYSVDVVTMAGTEININPVVGKMRIR